MEYRRLGLTDLEVSRIGFGCWALGGHGYGRVDDQDSIRAIHRALDLGINFFDTADVYGFGHAERVLQKGLGHRKKDVVIATKFGVGWDERGITFRSCDPKRVVRALEGSLQRLQIDCIPLYQIHWPDSHTPIQDTIAVLKKCQEQGKIRYISCSNFSSEMVRQAFETRRVESLQCLYNLAQRENEPDLTECATRFQMGIIVYGVLLRGLLSGKHKEDAQFSENDTRSRSNFFKGECLKRTLELVTFLRDVGSRYGKSSCQVAIRFVLENPLVTCALVGMKTAEQVETNVQSVGWSLLAHDKAEMNLVKFESAGGARAH